MQTPTMRGRRATAVLLGVIVVAAAVAGGVHLYARDQVNTALGAVPGSIQLEFLELISDHRVDDSPEAVFRVGLKLENGGREPMVVALRDLTLTIDAFGYLVVLNEPSMLTIAPDDASLFTGDIRIPGRILDELRTGEPVGLQVSGRVEAAAEHLWARGTADEPITVAASAVFD